MNYSQATEFDQFDYLPIYPIIPMIKEKKYLFLHIL